MRKNLLSLAKDKLHKYLSYLLIFISILLMVSLVRNIVKINNVNQSIKEEEEKVEKIREENEELEAKLEILRSDEYQEKQLRDKLGLAKEGELIVVLPEDEVLRTLAPKHVEEEETLPDPNWKKWAHLFGFNVEIVLLGLLFSFEFVIIIEISIHAG